MQEAHQDPRLKGLFFSSYLIKPIQRICKYPLLLKVLWHFLLSSVSVLQQEVVKATPEDHPDYENLVKATEEINDVVGHVNEGLPSSPFHSIYAAFRQTSSGSHAESY